MALSATFNAREVALERREAAFEQRTKEEALAKATTPQRQALQEAAAVVRDDLARPRGALLDASQSRDILLLYYGLVSRAWKRTRLWREQQSSCASAKEKCSR